MRIQIQTEDVPVMINNRIFKSGLLVLLLAMAACSATRISQDVKPEGMKEGVFVKTDVADMVIKADGAIKGEKKVAVPFFRVVFYTENDPGGFYSKGTTADSTFSVTIKSKLLGIDQATMQRITDAAYKDFIARLKAKGFEVLPLDKLKANAAYAKFESKSNPFVDKAFFGSDSTYFAPTGLKMHGDGMSAISTGQVIGSIVKDEQVSVIDATYYISFLSQEFEKTLGMVSGVKVGQTLKVTEGSFLNFSGYQASQCKGYCPSMVANVTMGQPVYSNEEFGEMKDTVSTAEQVAMKVFGGLGKEVHKYELNADPEKYESIATGLVAKVAEKFADALASKR